MGYAPYLRVVPIDRDRIHFQRRSNKENYPKCRYQRKRHPELLSIMSISPCKQTIFNNLTILEKLRNQLPVRVGETKMLNSVMTLCLTMTLGQAPVADNSNIVASPQAIGQAMGAVDPGLPAYGEGEGPGGQLSAGLTGSIEEELYPYDRPEPWIHGYWQEMPAYGGYAAFRPYNYKHVLAQSQTAGGWGMSAQMPYSQQFWHRYQQRAEMRTTSTRPRRNSANRFADHQARFPQNQIQQISERRSYRQPARSFPTQRQVPQRQVQRRVNQQFNRPAFRRPSQRSSGSGLAQRLAEIDRKEKVKNKKMPFWKKMFSRK